MGSAPKLLHLLPLLFFFIFVMTSASAFNLKQKSSANADNGDGIDSKIEEVSGGEVNGVLGIKIVDKFRTLLGLKRSVGHRRRIEHSFSPSPAPIEALTPAPAPSFSIPTRAHSGSPSPHSGLIVAPHNLAVRGRKRNKARIRRIIISVFVSAGATFLIVALIAIVVCRRFRGCRPKRLRQTNLFSGTCIGSPRSEFTNSVNSVNKVSFDPGPELFYVNSLGTFPEQVTHLKQISETKNIISNENPPHSPLREEGESSREPTNCELDNDSSSSAEEILPIESWSSDDESFHSLSDSHSSNARLSNVSEGSLSNPSEVSAASSFSKRSSSPDRSFAEPSLFSPTKLPTLPMTPDFAPLLALNLGFSPSASPNRSKRVPSVTTQSSPSSPPSQSGSRCTQIPSIEPDSSTSDLNNSPPSSNSESLSITPPSSSNHEEPLSSPVQKQPLLSTKQSVPTGSIPPPPCPPLPPCMPPPFPKSHISIRPPPPPCPKANGSAFPPPPRPCQFQEVTAFGKDGAPLPKLKPLHWDKVRAAPDRSMVWDKLRSSTFELDEEMIESLFGYNLQSLKKTEEVKSKSPSPSKHVLDTKRLQNITILSKALNATTEQICDALKRGDGLCAQQLEALVKMVPTKEEEDKLLNYQGDINELGSAEKFVKAMLQIPFAFLRIEAMLYRDTFEDEVVHLRRSFAMLEEACKELRSSRLFLKLLEAVLKTGNRMNVGTIRGGARAFKLDALLKLADVKGTDGKTTLLHFVVQEMTRYEGVRISDIAIEKNNQKSKPKTVEEREQHYRIMGLDLVSGLSTELCNVKKTATIDLDVLASSVSNLSDGMVKIKHLIQEDLSINDRIGGFVHSMKSFLNHAERSIKEVQEDEGRVLLHVREITEYFHGDVSKDEANPLRIFVIVRDFLGMLDSVCKELRSLKIHNIPNPTVPFR